MRDEVLRILADLKPTVDFFAAEHLFTSGALDSFDLILLIGELCEAFNVQFSPRDLTPENFDSVDSIVAMISAKQADKK